MHGARAPSPVTSQFPLDPPPGPVQQHCIRPTPTGLVATCCSVGSSTFDASLKASFQYPTSRQPAAMIEQHSPRVFTLSSSPHRQRSSATQQPPRSILKKPASAPSTPIRSKPPSPLTSPMMSPKIDTFTVSAYQPQQWTVVGIARTLPTRTSNAGASSPVTASTSLTVTLLYTPTETLYAWPFNLSNPGARGVCYETYSADQENGDVRRPPDGTMSTSLRVLADTIRCWMRIRRERSAMHIRRGSDVLPTSAKSGLSTLDEVVDNDEVIDEIIQILRLHPLTPFERSIHLLRQVLPDQPRPEHPGSREQANLCTEAQKGRRHLLDSSSSQGSDDERDSHHRSDSSASSLASTVEPSSEVLGPSKKVSFPKLPMINMSMRSSSPDKVSPVPEIRLVEATPQEAGYEERNRILEKVSRNASFSGRGMDTVQEDVSENADAFGSASPGARSTFEDGKVTIIEIQPSGRADSCEPKDSTTSTQVATAPTTASVKTNRETSSSSGRIFFRDPFRGADRVSSKPKPKPANIRVEAIEYGSPDALWTAPSRNASSGDKVKSPRTPSLEGLRSMFSSRSKPQ